MVSRSYIFFNVILSSCSLEYGVRKHIKHISDYSGSWYNPCPNLWSLTDGKYATCFPRSSETKYCVLFSTSCDINEVNELYVNIKTETRNCSSVEDLWKCTGKFNVSVHYETAENNFISSVLPDEIPKQIEHIYRNGIFYETDDDISFSRIQKYNRFKLGFHAPFYCGVIKSVSVYYYSCPAKTNVLVDFLEVPAPSKTSSPNTSVGTCTKNAVTKYGNHSLFMKCYYNGTFEVLGSCQCEAGYTNFYEKKRCKG